MMDFPVAMPPVRQLSASRGKDNQFYQWREGCPSMKGTEFTYRRSLGRCCCPGSLVATIEPRLIGFRIDF
jgi:hypothetical protein